MVRRPPKAIDPEAVARMRDLARMLDSRWGIPGTGMRFGLDGLIGLIPGVGDTATSLIGLYIVWRAHQLGLPRATIVRMLGNVGLDYVLGLIPLVGDLADFVFKGNTRNMALLNRHLDSFEDMAAERLRTGM